MAEPAERHNVNLSRRVWGELKLRSFQEGMSASELVTYVIERFTNEGYHAFRLPRYQSRSDDEDRLGRTVFVPGPAWQQIQKRAAQSSTSVSALIEYLLKQYLGMLPESENAESQPTVKQVVRVGEERIYLGENPVRIDLKTGRPLRPVE